MKCLHHQVICYGLSLPLNDHDAIRDCVHIYCEWLSALLPNPKIAVPQPIIKQPNHFARKIISHLHHLFMPRPGDGNSNSLNLRTEYFYHYVYVMILERFQRI